MTRIRWAALVGTLVLGGCGGGSTSREHPALLVSAATSLKAAFTAYGAGFRPSPVRYSFAGSDQLAAQIRQGAGPDVFASANTKLPRALHRSGLVETPTVFAANRLVLAVPVTSSKVRSLNDLTRRGVTIAVGSPSVPVGAYVRQALSRLPLREAAAIERNFRSNEPDVAGVVGKLAQGAVDAGFVYITDVRGAGGRLRAISLPARLEPRVAYAIAVVRGTGHPSEARAFIAGLLRGGGGRDLLAAGFEAAPGP